MLHTILRPFLLRRLKEDVERNIPPKKEIILYSEMTDHQKKFNDHLVSRTLEEYLFKTSDAPGMPFFHFHSNQGSLSILHHHTFLHAFSHSESFMVSSPPLPPPSPMPSLSLVEVKIKQRAYAIEEELQSSRSPLFRV